MHSIYTTAPHSSITAGMAEVSTLVRGAAELIQAIAQKGNHPSLEILGTQLDVYQQALHIVATHFDHPDLLIKDLFMSVTVRRSIMTEFRHALDRASVGDLLEDYVTIKLESASDALSTIITKHFETGDVSIFEAAHWLEMASVELDGLADSSYETWNAREAA